MNRSKTEDTSQYLDNMSFDDTYQQNAVEILTENAAGTALERQKTIATEATLQLIAKDYDNIEVDTSADPVFTITKKLGATVVDVKTITII